MTKNNCMLPLLILVQFLILIQIQSKDYQFKAVYTCKNNQFAQITNEDNQIEYICKTWVKKFQIKQKKIKYLRYESRIKTKLQQVQQQEQKQQEKQQKEQKKRQEQQKQKRKREREQRIKKIELSHTIKSNTSHLNSFQQEHSSEVGFNKDFKNLHQQQNSQDTQNNSHEYEDQLSNQQLQSHLNSQNLEDQYMQKSHLKLRKHFKQKKQGEGQQQQKFKPLVTHRVHPLDDILVIWSVIQMDNVVLQKSFFEGQLPKSMNQTQKTKILKGQLDEQQAKKQTEMRVDIKQQHTDFKKQRKFHQPALLNLHVLSDSHSYRSNYKQRDGVYYHKKPLSNSQQHLYQQI